MDVPQSKPLRTDDNSFHTHRIRPYVAGMLPEAPRREFPSPPTTAFPPGLVARPSTELLAQVRDGLLALDTPPAAEPQATTPQTALTQETPTLPTRRSVHKR